MRTRDIRQLAFDDLVAQTLGIKTLEMTLLPFKVRYEVKETEAKMKLEMDSTFRHNLHDPEKSNQDTNTLFSFYCVIVIF